MATHTTDCASCNGTLCISKGLGTLRVRAASMYFWLQMSLHRTHTMLQHSTAIKWLNSISPFGMQTNMRPWVCIHWSYSSPLTLLSGWYIRNHYKEAKETVHTLSSELVILKPALHINDDNFSHFLSDEFTYLNSVQQPPWREQISIRYVQVLDELEEWKYILTRCSLRWVGYNIDICAYGVEWTRAREAASRALNGLAVGDFYAIMTAVNNAQIQVELAFMKWQNTEALATHLQGQLGPESPWTIGGEEYNLYKEEAALGWYREALGDLERLVVMWLLNWQNCHCLAPVHPFCHTWQNDWFITRQAINSANKSVRVFNNDPKEFARPSCATTFKQRR